MVFFKLILCHLSKWRYLVKTKHQSQRNETIWVQYTDKIRKIEFRFPCFLLIKVTLVLTKTKWTQQPNYGLELLFSWFLHSRYSPVRPSGCPSISCRHSSPAHINWSMFFRLSHKPWRIEYDVKVLWFDRRTTIKEKRQRFGGYLN